MLSTATVQSLHCNQRHFLSALRKNYASPESLGKGQTKETFKIADTEAFL